MEIVLQQAIQEKQEVFLCWKSESTGILQNQTEEGRPEQQPASEA